MKDVFITIKGKSGTGDGKPETVEFATDGKMEITDGKTVLYYNEGGEIGAEGVSTVFTVNADGSVVMERSGGMTSRLEIIPNKRNNSVYSTAYGEMYIGVFGESIENLIGDSGGVLNLAYSLDQNLRPISHNEVEITVKEV